MIDMFILDVQLFIADRKTSKTKEIKVNTSRSTELLHSSLSSSASSTTSAISSCDTSTEVSPQSLQARPQGGAKSRDVVRGTGTLVSTLSASLHSSGDAAAVDKSAQLPLTVLKPKFTASVLNGSQGAVRTGALLSGGGKDSSQTQSLVTKSNQQSGNEFAKTLSALQSINKQSSSSPSSVLKCRQIRKETQADKDEVSRQKKKISFADLEPEVIGHDGGLDNLFPEEERVPGEENDHIYFSLTDEDKHFALLALSNTIWNSDSRNLQVANTASYLYSG